MAATNIMPAARGLRMGVGFGCLQRIAAAGIAWQLSVRRGTASEDGACSNDTMGRLGLQRTTAGCSASLGDSDAVHHWKTAQATTWLAGMMAEAVWRVCNMRLSSGGRGSSISDGVLGNGATLFFILAVI